MADKIFRDPLYNYVTIDRGKDGWLLELIDDFKTKIYSAYVPEPETEDSSPINAIRLLRSQDEGPIEISQVLTRLKAVTNKHAETVRYYVPAELRGEARKLRDDWKSERSGPPDIR